MAIIKAVECEGEGCTVLLKADSNLFFALYGNLSLGMSTPIFGNNIDDAGRVTTPQFYCKECFNTKITGLTAGPLLRSEKDSYKKTPGGGIHYEQ
jgi:hypothetical protein